MLKIREEYGDKYDVLFNPKKTQCMKFCRDNSNLNGLPRIQLSKQTLEWVDTVKYLGNWVTSDLKEKVEIDNKLSGFFGNVNKLSSCFKGVGYKNISMLFNSYCCHMYGSQAWRLNDKNVDRIFIAWNKAVRHLCKLPYTTHTKILPYVINTLSIKEQIYLRASNMIRKMLNSNNKSVKFLAQHNVNIHTSIIGENVFLIESHIEADIMCKNVSLCLRRKLNEMFNPDYHCVIEMLEIIEGEKEVQGFSYDEINDMMFTICTK